MNDSDSRDEHRAAAELVLALFHKMAEAGFWDTESS